MSTQVKIQEVVPLLQARVAYVSGGFSSEGFPIITLPPCKRFNTYSEKQLLQLMTYLTTVPIMNATDLGFVFVIDRRHDKWSSAKSLLMKIAAFFPAVIREVYVLRPTSFLQRTMAEVNFRMSKHDFKFKVFLIDSLRELHDNIDKRQLTADVGGTLEYSLEEWIEHRMAIEKYAENCQEISRSLEAVVKGYKEVELPNTLSAAEEMLEKHRKQKLQLKDDLLSASRNGETLLRCVKKPSANSATIAIKSPPDLSNTNACAIKRLLSQLEETEKNFDQFWKDHEYKLIQCQQFRNFELNFKEIKVVADEQMKTTEDIKGVAENTDMVKSLISRFEEISKQNQDTMEKAQLLQKSGDKLIKDQHYAVDSIQPKCQELEGYLIKLKQQTIRKKTELDTSLELHQRLDKAQAWLQKTMDFLSSLPEKVKSKEEANRALKEVENFLKESKEMKLDDPKEFRDKFEGLLIPEFKAKVQDTLQRRDSVQQLLESKKANLQKFLSKKERPVQVVPGIPKSPEPDSDLKRRSAFRTKSTKETENGEEEELSKPEPEIDLEALAKKRKHIMTELIETERVYVEELLSIIEGYEQKMNDQEMADLIPPLLKNKADILFGNLDEIYNFHSKFFLKDLESCINNPALVGRCFVDRKELFDIHYSTYCQNKPRSEILRRECKDDNPFFKECQKQLSHKLPLGAYLLKPVQRITKYQLLLRELLKTLANQDECEDFKEAQETMLNVLKHVNDSMHQTKITGYNKSLTELGKLLMQGPFQLWVLHKKKNIKDVRNKTLQRHLFLYEKAILFCKTREDLNDIHPDKMCYSYKSSLQMSEVGMTESIKGDKKKFELFLHRRIQAPEVYLIQAASEDIKHAWLREIRRLLQNQFLAAKAESQRNTLNLQNVQNANLSPTPTEDETTRSVSSESSSLDDTNANAASLSSGDVDMDSIFSDNESSDEDENGTTPKAGCIRGRYQALEEYNPYESGQLSMKAGDVVEVLKTNTGQEGMWLVKKTDTKTDSVLQGLVPKAFLEPIGKKMSRSASQEVLDEP